MNDSSRPHDPETATSYIDASLRSFLLKLSDRTPEPAGGAALALAAASAAALVGLACPPHRDEEPGSSPEQESCRRESEALRHGIQNLVDEDVRTYREVMSALGLPQSTPAEQEYRVRELDAALLHATFVPVAVAEAGLDVLELAVRIGADASTPAVGDLAAAVHLAEAAVRGSLRNASINMRAISPATDTSDASERIDRARESLAARVAEADALLRDRGLTD